VKVGPGALSGPKHVGLRHYSPSPQEVKVGTGALPELKHAGLGHDSPSS
jgi:hypothetical protein